MRRRLADFAPQSRALRDQRRAHPHLQRCAAHDLRRHCDDHIAAELPFDQRRKKRPAPDSDRHPEAELRGVPQMRTLWISLFAFVVLALAAGPAIFSKQQKADEELVVISPHWDGIRYEFAR